MAAPYSILEFRRLMSNPKYLAYVGGNFASSVGVWVQRVAIGWLTWKLTESPAWLGAVMFAEAGPTIILGLFAGAILDRYSQMALLRVTQMMIIGYSLALAGAVLAGAISIWLLFAMVLFRGAVFAVNRPARQTIVYALAGRDLLPNALAFNATVFNSSKFIGPGIAGAMIVLFGVGGTLLAAFLLQLVFTAALAYIGSVESARKPRESQPILREVADGFRYIAAHRGVRFQFFILGAVSLFAKPISDLLPGVASEVLQGQAQDLAILFAAHGIGAFAAGALLSIFSGRLDSVDLCAACVLTVSVATIAFASIPVFWAACGLLALIGACIVCVDVTSQTAVQSAIRTRFRGRTMSSYGVVAQGAPALGALLMGVVAEWQGLALAIAGGGGLCLVAGVLTWMARERIKGAF